MDSEAGRTTQHVRRAASGDARSLEWLAARLSPLLLSHASYRLGPALRRHYEPADLVGEAWLIALPKLAELNPRDGRLTPVLLRFLTTSVVHRVKYLARKHAREQPGGAAVEPPNSANSLPAEMSGALTRAMRQEREDQVRTSLDELAEDDRAVILLRGIEQLSNKAVGAQLGISAEAASKRYHRALERLRARLPQSVFDELADAEPA